MKSVLDVAGYFLYLGSMFLVIPIVLVLYLLLACWKAVALVHLLCLQLPFLFRHLIMAANRMFKYRWMPSRKFQLTRHLFKTS